MMSTVISETLQILQGEPLSRPIYEGKSGPGTRTNG